MGITRLSHDEQAAILDRVAHDPIVQAGDNLRAALKRFVRWPFSRKRRRALFAAWEDDHAALINRLMGTTGAAVVAPFEQLRDEQKRQAKTIEKIKTRAGDMEFRLSQLEAASLHEMAVGGADAP